MSKYIIKNCPCLFNSYYANGKTVRFECNNGNHDDKLCRDVTDCVLKQIVEECMEDWKDMMTSSFQRGILDLLDIREISDE